MSYKSIQIKIKSNHKHYKELVELSHNANNLYNRANFIVRQNFFKKKIIVNGEEKSKYLNNQAMNKILTKSKDKDYYSLPPATSISITKDLHGAWNSFFSKRKNKDKKCRPPKYLDKGGQRKFNFLSYQFTIKNNEITIMPRALNFKFLLPNILIGEDIKNIEFLPKNNHFIMSIRYKTNEVNLDNHIMRSVAGIDLGLDNLITMSCMDGFSYLINGKGLKSKNNYFNYKISQKKSDIKLKHNLNTCKEIKRLWAKRSNVMMDYIHKSTRIIVNICLEKNIDTIIIGHNKGQKYKCRMKNFVQIPVFKIIPILKYKLKEYGIKLIETKENYTSGTTFLDKELPIKKNYNIFRRKYRGIFVSNNGIKINSDVNSAYQMISKISGDVITPAGNGFGLNPIRINV